LKVKIEKQFKLTNESKKKTTKQRIPISNKLIDYGCNFKKIMKNN